MRISQKYVTGTFGVSGTRLKGLLKNFRLPVSIIGLAALIVALTSSGCDSCGGFGRRGAIPDAPYGVADDTLKVHSKDYISVEYVYECMDGEKVRCFFHSASECIEYEFSETRGLCDTSRVSF